MVLTILKLGGADQRKHLQGGSRTVKACSCPNDRVTRNSKGEVGDRQIHWKEAITKTCDSLKGKDEGQRMGRVRSRIKGCRTLFWQRKKRFWGGESRGMANWILTNAPYF